MCTRAKWACMCAMTVWVISKSHANIHTSRMPWCTHCFGHRGHNSHSWYVSHLVYFGYVSYSEYSINLRTWIMSTVASHTCQPYTQALYNTIEETRQRAASGRLWLIHSPAGTARAVCPCCVAHLWRLLSQLADTLRVLRLLLSQYELRIRAVIYFSVSPTQCTLWWL